MIAFKYRAVGDHGESRTGVVEASDRRGALHELAGRGLFPSLLELTGDGPAEARDRRAEPGETEVGRVSRKHVTAFTRQMATLLGATIPIPTALSGLAEQEANARLRRVISELEASVKRGDSFSASLARYPRLFSPLYSSMVEVGEESGQLPEVLTDLADYLEDQDEMRGEVLSAVAYPMFVLGFGGVTTFVLLTFVMPRLLSILDNLTDALPLPTRVLLGVSDFLGQWWMIGGVGLVVAVVLFWGWVTSPAGGRRWDEWKVRCPGMGRLFTAAALSRFSRTLGTLHRAGVSLLRALDIVKNTVGNRYIADRLEEVAEDTKGGDSLATPLRKLGLFPSTMVQMIAVGEDTGRLDDMLLKVARIQEKQVRSQSRALISLLGPVLIVVVGVAIGFIVISLLLPIFQISQSMR